MAEPTIDMYMTRAPHTIEPASPLADAHRMMRTHGIRHLPVVEGETLVGLVSRGDLHLFETLDGVDPDIIPVREAMITPVYTVAPDGKVRDVAMHMAQHKYGSAVVVDRGKVVGIFTAVDGLVGLSLLLQQLHEASR
jgi:acetoin utilization protein AcuB